MLKRIPPLVSRVIHSEKLASVRSLAAAWMRDHPLLTVFNLLLITACLVVLAISLRYAGRPVYQVQPDDELVVIVDIGHGGRDPGAVATAVAPDGRRHQLNEHALVYDVGARLVALLSAQAGIAVIPLLGVHDGELQASDSPVPAVPSRTVLRSTPEFDLRLHTNHLAVNMRWLLSNELYARAMSDGAANRRVIFLSLHMDKVPARTAGLTIYVPPGRPQRASGLDTDPYSRYEEVRDWLARGWALDRPVIDVAESQALAREIVTGFRRHRLTICPDRTIRSWIKRVRGDYVPAVLRYNQVPTRLLLELANIAEPADRNALIDPVYRDRLALAIYDGILAYRADQPRTASPTTADSM